MAKQINLDKIYSELNKENADKMFEALQKISEFVKKALTQQEQEAEDKATATQQKIQTLNGK